MPHHIIIWLSWCVCVCVFDSMHQPLKLKMHMVCDSSWQRSYVKGHDGFGLQCTKGLYCSLCPYSNYQYKPLLKFVFVLFYLYFDCNLQIRMTILVNRFISSLRSHNYLIIVTIKVAHMTSHLLLEVQSNVARK